MEATDDPFEMIAWPVEAGMRQKVHKKYNTHIDQDSDYKSRQTLNGVGAKGLHGEQRKVNLTVFCISYDNRKQQAVYLAPFITCYIRAMQ